MYIVWNWKFDIHWAWTMLRKGNRKHIKTYSILVEYKNTNSSWRSMFVKICEPRQMSFSIFHDIEKEIVENVLKLAFNVSYLTFNICRKLQNIKFDFQYPLNTKFCVWNLALDSYYSHKNSFWHSTKSCVIHQIWCLIFAEN